MSLRSLFLGCIVALAGLAAMSSDAKEYGQWQPLFNGKDLDGWQHVGPGRFVIENGVLKTEGGMGLLWYTKREAEQLGAARRVPRARADQGAATPASSSASRPSRPSRGCR